MADKDGGQSREASCSCGQLRVRTQGDPARISMCHCLACQQRTGSAFGMQARWPTNQVDVAGRYTEFGRSSDDGAQHTFRFCPNCGATVFWTTEGRDTIAVAIGAFADPSFPRPTVSVYGSRAYPWLSLPDGMDEEND